MSPELILFLDENHHNNKHLLSLLSARGVRHERHRDHFTPGLADIEWLPEIGRRKWALLTTDKRIRYRTIEKQAVLDNDVRMFCFSTNNMSGRDMANALGLALDKIKKIFSSTPAPFIAMITKSGNVVVRKDFNETKSIAT